MATISENRKQQLVALYENIKKLVLDIEDKYSPESRIINLDFPPTLGLKKLTYTKHTEAELLSIAQKQIAAKYTEKNRNLNSSYSVSVSSVNYACDVLAANHQKKLAELEAAHSKALTNLEHKLVDNGLWYSTMKTEAVAKENEEYAQNVAKENADKQSKYDAYQEKLSKLTENYNSAKSQLLSQQTIEARSLALTLAEKEKKAARDVEKYNASVDEKEAKYKANCERYTRYAQQAEDERAISILRLYAELGASGLDKRMKEEILSTCRWELGSCTKGEAEYIFSLDSFLETHLGSYYSSLVDWAKNTLFPDRN